MDMVPFYLPLLSSFPTRFFGKLERFLMAMAFMCRPISLVGPSNVKEYGYLATKVGTLHQELSERMLTHIQVYQDSADTVQSRMTASERGVMLRLR